MQEVTGSSPVPSTKTTRLIRVGSFCFGGRYRTRTARHRRRRGNKHPSGVFVSARFPTARNVYQERCRQTIRSGDFFRGGRYRTRTAAEATAACGGNREPRLGQRSDFSKPCQGAAEKSANATRKALTVRFCCGFHPLGMSTGEPSAAVQNSGFFIWWGYPSGTRTARHYFLLKKHVQNTSGRNGSCVLCTCFFVQRFFIAVSASSAAGSVRSLRWNSHPAAVRC